LGRRKVIARGRASIKIKKHNTPINALKPETGQTFM